VQRGSSGPPSSFLGAPCNLLRAAGELSIADPHVAAQALFEATARFHDQAHVAEWSDPDIDASFERVYALLEAGLQPLSPRR
jgi:hypothetical protein